MTAGDAEDCLSPGRLGDQFQLQLSQLIMGSDVGKWPVLSTVSGLGQLPPRARSILVCYYILMLLRSNYAFPGIQIIKSNKRAG